MWSDALLLWLFDHFPPRDLIFKESGGRPLLEYEDEVANPFTKFFNREVIRSKDVLDVGSGFGGRAVRWRELGAHSVVGLEVTPDHISNSRRFAEERGVEVDFVLGVGEDLPFADGCFQTVTMYDVLEHVVDPARVLNETFRVLRAGGVLACVFPGYYSFFGGSHLEGYATSVPGLNLLFTTRALRSAVRKNVDRHGWDFDRFFRKVKTDKLWNQNGLTVRRFHQLWRATGYEPVQVDHFGLRDRRTSRSSDRKILWPAFLAFETAARAPLVQEVMCSRVVALLARPLAH